MTPNQKAYNKVFGAAAEANAKYSGEKKVDGAYPHQVRLGKTAKDNGLVTSRKDAL